MISSAIRFQDVSKSYSVYPSAVARLKELATLSRVSFHQDFLALRNVTFDVSRGETFCIIGENGSGKSTLLQIIAGILRPSKGDIHVHGRVAALLELGSGFNPEFTGRDNVYLNAAILGSSKREIESRFREIEAFAEIGEYIDQPVKTYSSGMMVRLAFAVAIHVEPEILLIDEALSVGDMYFRQRCLRKVHEMRSKGATIIFVSHSTGDVQAIGDRAMWLDSGRIREIGAPDDVVNKYTAAMVTKDNTYLSVHKTKTPGTGATAPVSVGIANHIPNIDHRHGDGRAEIIGVAVWDAAGQAVHSLTPSSHIIVRISARAHQAIAEPLLGFMMRNHMGVDFAGTNTAREGVHLHPMSPGEFRTVVFHFQLPEFYPSSFSFSPAIADGTLESNTICDWIDNAIVFEVNPTEGQVYGYVHLPCRAELNQCLGAPAALSHAESNVG